MFITNYNTISTIVAPQTKFPFKPGDDTSKEAAMKLAAAHAELRKAQISNWLGRAPTDAELMRGRIDLPDTRTLVQKMEDDAWSPVKTPKRKSKYDQQIRDLGGDDDPMAAAYAETDPRQRQIKLLKAMRARDNDTADETAERETAAATHGERVAETVAEVESLREKLCWTPGATVSDVLQCEKTLAQLKAVDGCPEATAAAVAGVRAGEQQRHAAALLTAQERLAAATAEAARVASLGGTA